MSGPFQIIRAKHIGYDATGLPLMVDLPSDQCVDSHDQPETRHVSYTQDGIPQMARFTVCCPIIWDTRVEHSCYFGVGLDEKMGVLFDNVANCPQFRDVRGTLTYDPVAGTGSDGAWVGTVEGIYFEVQCIPGAAPDFIPSLSISYRGCVDGDIGLAFNCYEPAISSTHQVNVGRCCDCVETHTSQTAQVAFTFITNCRHVRMCRHVDYDATGLPLMAISDPCVKTGWDNACETMTCGLFATITSNTTGTDSHDCACMEGIYSLDYITNDWQYISGTGFCNDPAEMSLVCEDAGEIDGEPWIRLSLSVVCGVDNVGGGWIEMPAADLYTINDVIPVLMTWDDTGCGDTASCTWQWNEMPMSWSQLSLCSGDCTCPTPSGTGLPGAGMGLADGDTTTTSCSGGRTVPCCEGYIDVLITRRGD